MDDSTNLMNETYHGAIGGLAADDYSKVYVRDILGRFFCFPGNHLRYIGRNFLTPSVGYHVDFCRFWRDMSWHLRERRCLTAVVRGRRTDQEAFRCMSEARNGTKFPSRSNECRLSVEEFMPPCWNEQMFIPERVEGKNACFRRKIGPHEAGMRAMPGRCKHVENFPDPIRRIRLSKQIADCDAIAIRRHSNGLRQSAARRHEPSVHEGRPMDNSRSPFYKHADRAHGTLCNPRRPGRWPRGGRHAFHNGMARSASCCRRQPSAKAR